MGLLSKLRAARRGADPPAEYRLPRQRYDFVTFYEETDLKTILAQINAEQARIVALVRGSSGEIFLIFSRFAYG